MRLLLDAHISGSRVGTALSNLGHDVRALNEDLSMEKLEDDQVLALATLEDRILVTFDVSDFAPIVVQWAEAGRSHSGCAIFVGIDHSEFGLIIRRLQAELSARPDPKSWRDYTRFISRSP